MEKLEEARRTVAVAARKLPVTVIIPVRNEAKICRSACEP